MTKEHLMKAFLNWHDTKHAEMGYWPTNVEIGDWWLDELSLQRQELLEKLEGEKVFTMYGKEKISASSVNKVKGWNQAIHRAKELVRELGKEVK